jgi:integrase/recombinase XerD
MLEKLYPRGRFRITCLPLLGQYVEDFTAWLHARGFTRPLIRLRLQRLPRVDAALRKRGAVRFMDISASDLLRVAPKDSQQDLYLSAVVRSLARYCAERRSLAIDPVVPSDTLVGDYISVLRRVRGLAESTQAQHRATASEFLTFVGFEDDDAVLWTVGPREVEAFLKTLGPRLGRASLQHTVAHLRSFLRFLASRGLVNAGLDTRIDTPRLYRGEQLPRTLSWEVIRGFMAAIDRATPMGKRDFAMFMLVVTYGLRTSEVTSLRLDNIRWRTGQLCVARPKTGSPLVLPLTEEVGAAVIDYLRHARPPSVEREVFLRVRAPVGSLKPTAVTEAFQGWSRRSNLPIPYQGPHCLRHSLAVHLLRQGAPLKAIGDLLGHRSLESTCVYLRLHVEDLRDVALNLPLERVLS